MKLSAEHVPVRVAAERLSSLGPRIAVGCPDLAQDHSTSNYRNKIVHCNTGCFLSSMTMLAHLSASWAELVSLALGDESHASVPTSPH